MLVIVFGCLCAAHLCSCVNGVVALRIITSLFGHPKTLLQHLVSLGVPEVDVRDCDHHATQVQLQKLLEECLVCPQAPAAALTESTLQNPGDFLNQHEVVGNVVKVMHIDDCPLPDLCLSRL